MQQQAYAPGGSCDTPVAARALQRPDQGGLRWFGRAYAIVALLAEVIDIYTPLICAVGKGYARVVRVLLKAGANLAVQADEGFMASHFPSSTATSP